MKRVFLIVTDSLGIGAMPDAERFGDLGTNTLKAIYNKAGFTGENLKKLGIFNIDGIDFAKGANTPVGAYCRLSEASDGKDTTIGHFEISGVISLKPFPTYPDGFPDEIINEFKKRTGRGVLCNKPYSGTEVIKDYGKTHIETGDLIVYTSADSVFQIAANEDIVPLEKLYEYCKIAREILQGGHAVARVIARPFKGEPGNFYRTSGRHDYSVEPPCDTLLDLMKEKGFDVISIGKIYDIFAHRGFTEYTYTTGNTQGMELNIEMQKKPFKGLCFTNLVDFDMLYGHRNDALGYAKAAKEFDEWLPSFMERMKDDDILMITSDHGCDPSDESTDHSREYTYLLVYGRKIKPVNLGTRKTFSDIGKTIADIFGISNSLDGESFKEELI
ncbi:MAG: phosphopentomutase [Bacillota bacterium]|nr:phosphopentomutase [Bacillota bacterium]